MYNNEQSTPVGAAIGWIRLLDVFVPPFVATVLLYVLSAAFSIETDEPYLVLGVLTLVITFVVYREMASLTDTVARRPRDFFQRSVSAWAVVVACLAVLAFVLQYGEAFSRRALLTWAVVTPVMIATAQYWMYQYAIQSPARRRKAVIAGISDLSRRLAQSLENQPGHGLDLVGWFEDRSTERTGPVRESDILGRLGDLPDYVKQHHVDVIYIALPIRHEERTRRLLDELHDTTASIYFVPDIFVFDLIQSRVEMIDGIPALALCETPFYGINGLVKRLTDVCFASVILLLAAPVMLTVAAAVAATTRGSMLFKQRRYGLDGREILVYKFRTMDNSDDDDDVRQAERDDPRVTPLGRFLRRYSLDELPQLFNVLGGSMSLVGPRPHAVAHNEQYRRLIKGYMIRHKVAPGITGLAQIRGHRGETKTIEEMKARVDSDLEYLRRWSFSLDLKILIVTILRVFGDKKAY